MHEVVAVVAALFVVLGLLSGVLRRIPVTAPMIALGAGVLLGPGLGVLPTELENRGVLLLAELALAVLLFADATRIDVGLLRRNGQMPARMLLVGLPGAIGLGTLAGVWVLGLDAGAAFVLACLLAPTDAALGQAVMSDRRVPHRIRQALNVESGLNDGLAVPFLTVALVMVEARAGGGSLLLEAAQLIGVGVGVGLLTGGGVALLLRAIGWERLEPAPRQVGTAALPLVAFAVASLLGGNGFVAAFVAGGAFGALTADAHALVEFGEDAGEMLALLTFLVFGALFIGPAAAAVSVPVIAFGVLSLTVVRMVPVAGSLLGLGLRRRTLALLGWFGPRGLATVVFGLEVLELAEEGSYPLGEELFGIAALVVVASVILHGMSARPLTSAYAAAMDREAGASDRSEDADAPEHPMRRSAAR